MEIIVFLVALYGGIWLIGWLWEQISKWNANQTIKIRNEAAEDAISENNLDITFLDVYRKKLKKIGYSSKENGDNYYQNYILTDGNIKYSQMLNKCPSCKSGDLIIRKGYYDKKKFIGCTNFPTCRYNASIKVYKEKYQRKSEQEFLNKFKLAYG